MLRVHGIGRTTAGVALGGRAAAAMLRTRSLPGVPVRASASSRKTMSAIPHMSSLGASHTRASQAELTGVRLIESIKGTLRGSYGFMTRPRQIKMGSMSFKTNLSNLCGHASFCALALGYMESDVLMLRGYAATGIATSMLFQYYRPQPLWLPLGWNGLFLLINGGMIALLMKEQSEAAHFDDEEQKVYDAVFSQLGVNAVDYLKLLRLADRREVPAGKALAVEGQKQRRLYLLVTGKADISQEGTIGRMGPNQYVGSISFLKFLHGASEPGSEEEGPQKERTPESKAQDTYPASTTVTTTAQSTVYCWDFHLLRAYLKQHPDLGSAMQVSIGADTSSKLDQLRTASERYRQLLGVALEGGEVTPMEKKKLIKFREEHDLTMEDHHEVLSAFGWTDENFEAGFRQEAAPKEVVNYHQILEVRYSYSYSCCYCC
ncbi:unnamed protein product [Chrysoparadoxa australica]